MSKFTEVSQNCINLIEHFEGCKLTAYKDTNGIWTIGFGNTYYPFNHQKIKEDDKITKDAAINILHDSLGFFEKQVDSFTRDDISQNQFDSLVDFAYNCGDKTLKNSTLIKKINDDLSDHTIWGEFLKYDKDENKVQRLNLVKRRNAEAHLYFKNELNFYENLKL
jgi:lysozyme